MISVYDLTQSIEWDEIVKSFHDYDVFWMSGYVRAFEIHGDGKPLLILNERNEGRGITVVMKRDISNCSCFKGIISKESYFDIASPYGYGGWIVDGEISESFFKDYSEWCYRNGIISEFVRFHPVIQNHKYCIGAYDIVPLGNTIAIDLANPDTIWSNIHSKNRNMIRKAKKNGVEVFWGRSEELFSDFKRIYDETMKKDNAEEYYYFEKEFYNSILYDLPYNSLVFYAKYNGEVIAAAIILIGNKYMSYHLSGQRKEYASLAATNLLLYEVSLWGSMHGFKSLYLGGGVGSKEDSLYKFKKSFFKPNTENRYYVGKLIFDQKRYDELTLLRGNTERVFFPQYRA